MRTPVPGKLSSAFIVLYSSEQFLSINFAANMTIKVADKKDSDSSDVDRRDFLGRGALACVGIGVTTLATAVGCGGSDSSTKTGRGESLEDRAKRETDDTFRALEQISGGVIAHQDDGSTILYCPVNSVRHNGRDYPISQTRCYRLDSDTLLRMSDSVGERYTGSASRSSNPQIAQRVNQTRWNALLAHLRMDIVMRGIPIQSRSELPAEIAGRVEGIHDARKAMERHSDR